MCGISAGAWVKYEGRCEHISNTLLYMVIQVILSDLHSTSNISFSEKRAQSFSINGINGTVIIAKKQYLVRSPKISKIYLCFSVFFGVHVVFSPTAVAHPRACRACHGPPGTPSALPSWPEATAGAASAINLAYRPSKYLENTLKNVI